MKLVAIRAFTDNYIWALVDNGQAVVIDPGDAEPVLKFLKHSALNLLGVMITHHHFDHVGGIADLVTAFPNIKIYGPADGRIPYCSDSVDGGERVLLPMLGTPFDVISVPGHTLDHIAYYHADEGVLFCGDTLFAGGCGRLFEGTAEQLYASLQVLKRLPGDTRVFCAHEYTLDNLRFALMIEPDNGFLQSRFEKVVRLRDEGEITLPSTLSEECATNPFLRVHLPSVRHLVFERVGKKLADDVDVFRVLREMKDNFR